MKKTFLTTLTLLAIQLCSMQTADAQNLKFGKPSADEIAMTSVPFAPDAEAVVLCKTVEAKYEVSPSFSPYSNSSSDLTSDGGIAMVGQNDFTNPEGLSITYTVKQRVKILKDSGKDYANLAIFYFNGKDDEMRNFNDEIYSFNVTVFNDEGGKLKKKRLNSSCWKDIRVDDNMVKRVTTVPDAKAGTIVEYQFQISSTRINQLYDTRLQENIPLIFAQCDMDIPAFLQFNVNATPRANVKAEVTRSHILVPMGGQSMENPIKFASNHYHVTSAGMEPWDESKAAPNDVLAGVRSVIKEDKFEMLPPALNIPPGKTWMLLAPDRD